MRYGDQHDDNTLWVEIDGRLYAMTLTDDMPTDADGQRRLMVMDDDKQTIQCHKGVPIGRRAGMMAKASGHNPEGAIWRLVPADEQLWKHVPQVAAVD